MVRSRCSGWPWMASISRVLHISTNKYSTYLNRYSIVNVGVFGALSIFVSISHYFLCLQYFRSCSLVAPFLFLVSLVQLELLQL